ncbi:MAG: peptide chain release factor N(5)-glutamine methyltransferase [Bacillota bacterium]
MNIKTLLNKTTDFFEKKGIANPRLDAEVLLADLLGMERIKLYVNFDYPLTETELAEYRKRVVRRAKREAVSYITGHKEFMSLDFKIKKGVLIPRPETELLVENIIDYCEENELEAPNIVEVGPGSGVIMVSLGHYLENAKILGIDISKKAVEVSRENIEYHELGDRLTVNRGDLLSPLLKRNTNNVDIVVSNPPYISDEEMENLAPEIKNEPELALKAGKDGLDLYKKLIPQAVSVLKEKGLLALEIGYDQADKVKKIIENEGNYDEIRVIKDYSGKDRMIFCNKKEIK